MNNYIIIPSNYYIMVLWKRLLLFCAACGGLGCAQVVIRMTPPWNALWHDPRHVSIEDHK